MLKHLQLVCFFFLTALFAMSQDLQITYDHRTGKTTYNKLKANGDTASIDKPFVKRNKKIVFRAVNINPFAFQVSHQVAQSAITRQFDSTKHLFPYFGEGLMQYEKFLKAYISVDTNTRGARGVGPASQALLSSVDSLIFIDNELAAYMDCYSFIKGIVVSGDLSKESIVSNIDSAIKGSFGLDDDASALNTSAMIRAIAQRFIKHYRAVKQYQSSLKTYIDTTQDLVLANRLILGSAHADSLHRFYSDGVFLAKVAGMGQLLQTVKNARFIYEFEEIADMDVADLTITITNRQARLDADTMRNVQNSVATIKKYRIIIRGEMVVRSSVGISLPTLLGKGVRYGVQDLKVTEFDDDKVIPNLTTFVNFYPFRGSFSNTGGVIGFGYPLSGEEKNLNILMGLSQSFGDKNAVVLSTGIAVGQTNKLESGWKIGDPVTDPNINIPTDKSWKVGLFAGLSISFNNR